MVNTLLDSRGVLVSVIVPAFNEEQTIDDLLGRLLHGPYPYPDKEIIVIDDGSTDGTALSLQKWKNEPGVLILRHPCNRGKGAAVRTGLARARGEITIIQDADLEYDPADFPKLVEIIRQGQSDVVYGSRYLAPKDRLPWNKFRLAVYLLNKLVWVLYGQRLTDEATCYKAFRTNLLRDLDLKAQRFELCAEVTAKICRLGIPIVEVPISYRPRTSQEGKKIGWRDAVETFWTLAKWRFCAWTRPGQPEVTHQTGRIDKTAVKPARIF